ncbi:MAG TPA: alpha/beta fold hydrolase [Phycisphaerae bacterium]|nr:alpha/beta fold hydrolase [Phycisphaerae bacterium]
MRKFHVLSGLQVCVLPCFLAVLLCTSSYAQSQPGDADPVKIAEKFAGHFTSGRYAEAVKLFGDEAAKALPEAKLKEVWESLSTSVGDFESFGKPTTSKTGPRTAVIIPVTFKKAGLNFRIIVNTEGRIDGFLIQPGGPAVEYKPAEYDKPKRYREKDVTFGKEPWLVKGKLTLPKSKKDVPAVVLVHGSGPNDEDETIGPNKPFRDLAGGLSSQGIAVLRYPKRTYAYGPQMVKQKTISVREEVIDDALEALKFLRSQKGIDGSQVYLLGHSLGATLAPAIAAEDKDLAGVIMLAGSPRNFADVIEDQLTYIASLPGPGQEGNKKVLEESRDVLAKLRDGSAPPDAKLLGAPAPYWKEVSEYSTKSPGLLAGLKCPLLIAGGGRDYQVTRSDFDIYKKALKDRELCEFKWYKSMSHLFMRGKGKATPDEYAQTGHVDEKVVDDLAGWIKADRRAHGMK